MRTQIERWLLIALLAFSYLSRVPGLIRQGMIGAPALVIGFIISAVLITLLVKSSAKAALLVAVMTSLSVIFLVLGSVVGPASRDPDSLSILLLIPPIIGAFCAIDLWSAWSKKSPNKSPQPTAASRRG